MWSLRELLGQRIPQNPVTVCMLSARLYGTRIIDYVMITVISYIGILGAFLTAATVMYLGVVKIKLI